MEIPDQGNSSIPTIGQKIDDLIIELVKNGDDDDYDQVGGLLGLNSRLLYLKFSEKLNEVNHEFVLEFFDEFKSQIIDQFSSHLIRDLNSLWRVFYFLFKCIDTLEITPNSGGDKQEEEIIDYRRRIILPFILERVEELCTRMLSEDSKKFTGFFQELFIQNYVEVVKNCQHFEKKSKYISLLYFFFGSTTQAKIEACVLLKSNLDDQKIFMQALSVLVKLETSITEENKDLIEIYKFYAKSGLISRKTDIKICSLQLLGSLAELDYEWVQREVVRFLPWFSAQDWWEIRINYLVVMSKILTNLVKSDLYQSIMKRENEKFVTSLKPDEEKLVAHNKEIFKKFAEVLEEITLKNKNGKIVKCALIYFAELVKEIEPITKVYVKILLSCNQITRDWALYTEPRDPEELEQEAFFIFNASSRSYRVGINSAFIEEAKPDILAELSFSVKEKKNHKLDENFVDMLTFCLRDTTYEKLNIEIFDTLVNNTLDYFLKILKNENMMKKAQLILQKYFELFLKREVLIHEFEMTLAGTIAEILNKESVPIKSNLKEFLELLIDEYHGNNPLHQQYVKFTSQMMSKALPLIFDKEEKEWMLAMFEEEEGNGRIEERMIEEEDEEYD